MLYRLGLLLLLLTLAGPLAAQPTPSPIYLRRAAFDPLLGTLGARTMQADRSTAHLWLVQLQGPPGRTTAATLAAAGLRPLAYIPEHTYLVRALNDPERSLASLSGVRWAGRYTAADKQPAELDTQRTSQQPLELALHLTSDVKPQDLAQAVRAAGGLVHWQHTGLNGTTLGVRLAPAGLQPLLQRDDLLWAAPLVAPRLLNDNIRAITGVAAARQQLTWLTGAGQTVAISDSGLDNASSLSADFAGRVRRGFAPSEVGAGCATSDWSDRDGHGTHVAGTILGSGTLAPVDANLAPTAALPSIQKGKRYSSVPSVPSVANASASSYGTLAGVAPAASAVVVAAFGEYGIACGVEDGSFLERAQQGGASIHNASFGAPVAGDYDNLAQIVDDFLWRHPEHLLVVSAGNSGVDADSDGVIDPGSLNSPASAKNVLAVGASESNRPPTAECNATTALFNCTWGAVAWASGVRYTSEPIRSDAISDQPVGMAAFSSRGPASDGRIKPEIVAPGVAILSAASHHPAASYDNRSRYGEHYAYKSGTSMAAPAISGLAVLLRQWLAEQQGIPAPSAALLKALLLNGAFNIAPGQYGAGTGREIPAGWPNNVEGWGRAALDTTLGLGGPDQLWMLEDRQGLATGDVASYRLYAATGAPLRLTLAWNDYPAAAPTSRALVNDLDLELLLPDGTTLLRGNGNGEVPEACRLEGADRCNNSEAIEVAAPVTGVYTVQVRGVSIAQPLAAPRQPFALVAQATQLYDAPSLQASATDRPVFSLSWGGNPRSRYEIEQLQSGGNTTTRTLQANGAVFVLPVGSHSLRVRACGTGGCGPFSNTVTIQVATPAQQLPLPRVDR